MTTEDKTFEQVAEFHGHVCPGLAMGVQASRLALREIGPHSSDEEIVAVVETDMCGVDAIQVMTGCTFGKGNLRHRDWGKNAFTFYRRSDGKAIRIASRPDGWARDPEHLELGRLVRAGAATPAQQDKFRELHVTQAYRLLELDPQTLFTVTPVKGGPPPQARIHDSVRCARCGENVMETRLRRLSGADLCPPCFEAALGAG